MTPEKRQKLFNTVVRGLAGQGWKQARDAEGGCALRGENGTRCAVGHLVTDDEAKAFDLGSVFSLRESGRQFAAFDLRDYETYNFLEDLQEFHDTRVDPDIMRHVFKMFAARNGLDWPLTEDPEL